MEGRGGGGVGVGQESYGDLHEVDSRTSRPGPVGQGPWAKDLRDQFLHSKGEKGHGVGTQSGVATE